MTIGDDVTIAGLLKISGSGTVQIGDRVQFAAEGGPSLIFFSKKGGMLVIGDGCFINGATFVVRRSVTIGQRCLIGGCTFMDTDFHHVGIDRLENKTPLPDAPIVCADNVWVADKALVLKGVTIGRNSVVGAACVVRTDVPDNVLVIGNPQQIVKQLA